MSDYNQQTQENQERKKSPILYWVIILLLLIGCAFLFWSKSKTQEDSEAVKRQLLTQLDSLRNDRASLQSDFEAASAKIDQLVSLNAQLDSNLQKDQAEIRALQQKIRSMLVNSNASTTELKKTRELINTLTEKTNHYEARIAELEKENAILTNKNVVLTKERDSTVTQNIAIKKIASALHATNIRMEPLHLTKSGKEKTTTKAKKVDVLRIKFDIDVNHIAESGTKLLYIRVLAPDGTILKSESNGSGFLTTHKGDQITYSVKKEVALIKEEPLQDISTDWRQVEDYPKGVYLIEVFSEGYKVGSGNVSLK